MPKVKYFSMGDASKVGVTYWCPGCQERHAVYLHPYKNPATKASWKMTGTLDNPTLVPSVQLKGCHSHVIDGEILYLEDCDHELRGQTVPMVDLKSLNAK